MKGSLTMRSVILFLSLIISSNIYANVAKSSQFAFNMCKKFPKKFHCKHVGSAHKLQNWSTVIKNTNIAYLMRINRKSTPIIKPNTYILLPKMPNYTPPFPKHLSNAKNSVVFDLSIERETGLAWAAYDELGNFIKWGPANGGRGICFENKKPYCKTPVGSWRIMRRESRISRSKLYPRECKNKKKCGHVMYWYVQFHKSGVGMHGDASVPGWNISHGCVRLFAEDAKWLNTIFITKSFKNKRVIVLPY